MKASSRPSPPSVNYIINNGMNFLRASGSLPTPFSNHWKALQYQKRHGRSCFPPFPLSPPSPALQQQRIDGGQFSISIPYIYSAQLLLLLNEDERKQLSDACTTGILLGKAEVYFIVLQRQHLKYATELLLQNACTEAQTGTKQSYPKSSLFTSTIPKLNQKQAAAIKPTWIVTAVANFLDARKYFVIPILLPTKYVSEAYSENMPASCKQEVGRGSITWDIRAHSPLNFAQSSQQPASLATLRDHLLLQEQSSSYLS